ncbi:hypothetical protein [Bradyrhizobium sp. USDA 10063]
MLIYAPQGNAVVDICAVCRVQMLESLINCSNRANAAGMKVAIEVQQH